jgi:hypothetical protein
MDIFFPTQTLPLFQVLAPCFTAPSFAYFQSYVWALMVVEGRKCMTRLARCVFFHQRDLSSWERFLAEHRWSLTAVTARLVTLVVAKLGDQLQVHGAYLLGTDTTLVAKTAKRMLGGPDVERPQRQRGPRRLSGRPPLEPRGADQSVGGTVAVLASGHALGPGAPGRPAMGGR